ncbi:FAD:protein FMN transferase [Pseudaeromonas sp. ZJS20]|uniref:FAD:protein FMN transferase n=1 Tax=Pseudaeromonas aegiceratis TaxID=3153928 RepID=UPI00390CC129
MKSVVSKMLALCGLAFLLAGCNGQSDGVSQELHITGNTMGTYYSIKVADGVVPDAKAFQAEVDKRLERVNDLMSTYRPQSTLSRFNQFEELTPFTVEPDVAKVVTEAVHIGRLTGGALDITVGPLVNLWGFGPDHRPTKMPDEAQLAEVRKRTGLGNLHVEINADADTLRKDIPGLYLDLSSIAKGYGVDQVASYIESLGSRNYLVEIGGELRVKGHNGEGQDWRVAIEKPTADLGSVQEVIKVGDMGIATSGDYRNYYELDGQRLSHTIDPVSGKPINHKLVSVTVVAPECMTADGLATALMVLGTEKGLAFAKAHHLAIFMITKTADGFKEDYSDAFAPYLER